MASSISADSGLSSGTSGIKITSDNTGVLALQSGNNTTAITVDTSQNVGIGTTSPSARLQVNSAYSTDTTPQATILESGGGIGTAMFFGLKSDGTRWIMSKDGSTSTAYPMAFYTGTTERMRIDSSGNVGVGVTNMPAKFNVQNTTNSSYAYSIRQPDQSSSSASAGWYWGADNNCDTYWAYNNNSTYSEKIRITNGGRLLVGTTSNGYSNTNGLVIAGDSGQIITNHPSGTASGTSYTQFVYNSSNIGSITQNGTTAVAYNTSSDYRLKENIAPLTGALNKVAQLKPVTYTWKSAPDETGEGFIAHELAEVCPQAVHGTKDAVDADGNPVYQGIDTSFLVATLTAAIQELKAINDQQAETINALTARIVALEGK